MREEDNMQKTIRILAIISAVLVGFSLALLIVSLPFQRLLAQVLGYPEISLAMLPTFPFVPFLSCFLRAGCIAALIICCGNKKGGIWLEILMLAILVIVLPFLTTAASTAYTTFIGRYGNAKLVAISAVSRISDFCCHPANWGQALAYITCGMSIAFKTMRKKQNSEP